MIWLENAVAGGGEKMDFRVSLGYLDQDGVVKPASTQRLTLNVGYNQLLFNDRLRLTASVLGARTDDVFTPGGVLGTSTNFDVVSADGAYVGGVIAPGVEIATNALVGGTAALRRVEFTPPRSPIGKGTVEAIQSGALYGHAGLVDGLVERITEQLEGDPITLATGGLASTIVPHCRRVETIDEYLTLEGLRLIYEMNQ